MLINLLSPTKLIITLDSKDQKKYNLTYETLDYSRSEIRSLIKDFIHIARIQTGFEASEKILIEVFPKPDGEICLYITNISNETQPGIYNCFIVEFSSLDSLERCCEAISSVSDISECDSGLYYCAGKYILVFKELNCRQLYKIRAISSEFCTLSYIGANDIFFYAENYRLIAEHGAVKKLT